MKYIYQDNLQHIILSILTKTYAWFLKTRNRKFCFPWGLDEVVHLDLLSSLRHTHRLSFFVNQIEVKYVNQRLSKLFCSLIYRFQVFVITFWRISAPQRLPLKKTNSPSCKKRPLRWKVFKTNAGIKILKNFLRTWLWTEDTALTATLKTFLWLSIHLISGRWTWKRNQAVTIHSLRLRVKTSTTLTESTMMASHLRDQANKTSSAVVLHDTIVNPLLKVPKKRATKNVQLVLQHCCKTSWIVMLRVLPVVI